ncbi:response regulator [Telmatospirillum sp. J64-1]|uniref:response regulator n=1 Tax=Telmatospirillum sp. J64-1 TaxID=2502183 RepID=UPI00163D40A7|nr:response regulator [Telmatospirillum sp. J64-1]
MERLDPRIVQQFPYLRRYARALTGSQIRGDNYVRACIEALLADPSLVSADQDLRLRLFSFFHDVWTLVHSSEEEGEHQDGGDPLPTLEALPPINRQVLLLTSLEGFTLAETAWMLGLTQQEVRDHLSRAREELGRQNPARVLIIEDESIISLEIQRIIEEMGHEVAGVAANRREALNLIDEADPSLILSDINLKDGDDGIVTVREIIRHVGSPIVFVTAFPERLLTGEVTEPAFVVPKPFTSDALKTAVGQALSIKPPPPVAAVS